MNTAGHMLEEAGEIELAKKLYLAQLDKAPSPHYFMSGLASIAREQDRDAEAIAWMRKAYQKSEGAATRFQ